MQKEVTIAFNDQGITLNLKGNPTRVEILGCLELARQTILLETKIPINIITDKPIKVLQPEIDPKRYLTNKNGKGGKKK